MTINLQFTVGVLSIYIYTYNCIYILVLWLHNQHYQQNISETRIFNKILLAKYIIHIYICLFTVKVAVINYTEIIIKVQYVV